MSSTLIWQLLRALFLLLLQTLVLQNVPLGKVTLFIYPIFVLLLPFALPRGLLIAFSFAYGILVDMFYNTLGLHAFAMTMLAYARAYVCAWIEPRDGYAVTMLPTKADMGITWFMWYSGILMFLHTFLVVTLQELSFGGIWWIRMIFGYLLSMLAIVLYQYIFNPKD